MIEEEWNDHENSDEMQMLQMKKGKFSTTSYQIYALIWNIF